MGGKGGRERKEDKKDSARERPREGVWGWSGGGLGVVWGWSGADLGVVSGWPGGGLEKIGFKKFHFLKKTFANFIF